MIGQCSGPTTFLHLRKMGYQGLWVSAPYEKQLDSKGYLRLCYRYRSYANYLGAQAILLPGMKFQEKALPEYTQDNSTQELYWQTLSGRGLW